MFRPTNSLKLKDCLFTIIDDGEKKQILTFKNQQMFHVFVLKLTETIIELVGNEFSFNRPID